MSCPEMMELEGFLSRELDRETSARIADHLASCEQCSRELGELENDLRLADQLRDHQPVCGVDLPTTSVEVPEVIGPYRVLRKLGEGGMGTVFEAQQEHPRRIVALKILRPGLVSETLLARFRREAQTLGRLQHPGIAQIYEASTYESPRGRQPYFVMESIRGPGLMEYAQTSALSVRGRLELMAKVCDAVQHAHQRGVIHRDLKPDNILIDESGDEPQPKILDFGVARVIDPEQRATTLHTSVGQIVGTVAYMSPEQANAEPSDVDTRSDVYALGVICYELLAARLPYSINKTSIVESVRAIVQDEPTPLATVDRSLRGDVSTIVGKTLEKDKARRYQSAAEMGADIRRHLRDEPISAHPPSTVYQLRKFARRNKGLVAGLAAAIVLLILGVIGTSIGMVRAQRSAIAARTEAAKATAVNQFLNDMLNSADANALSPTERAKGPNVTMVQVLNEASNRLQNGSLKEQPAIEAAVRRTIGTAYLSLGEFDAAEQHLSAALALDQKLYGEAHRDVMRDQMQLGLVLHQQGKWDEAERLYKLAMDAHRKQNGEESSELADCYLAIASIARDRGNLGEAESLFNKALALHRKLLGEEHALVAADMHYLAVVLEQMGRLADAEPLHRRALQIRRELLGDEHPRIAVNLHDFGVLLYRQGKFPEAEMMYREALAIQEKRLGPEHPDVASTLNSLMTVLHHLERYDEAERVLRRSIEIKRNVYGEQHEHLLAGMNNLAMLLLKQGKFEEAEPVMRRVVEVQRSVMGADHPDLAATLNNLGGLLKDQKRFAEAEPAFREAMEIRRKRLGEDHPEVALTMYNFASLLRDQQKPADAEPFFRKALATLETRLGANHPNTAILRSGLGVCLVDLKRYDEAEPLLVESLGIIRSTFGETDKRTVALAKRLISVYEAQGKPSQANALRPLVPATNPTTIPTTVPGATGESRPG